MKRLLFIGISLLFVFNIVSIQAQDRCGELAPRLTLNRHGTVNPGKTVDVYQERSDSEPTGLLEENTLFQIVEGPVCVDGVNRWNIVSDAYWGVWIPETVNGQYVVEPYRFIPATPVALDVPLTDPVISDPEVPLPTVTPLANPDRLDLSFTDWDWYQFIADYYYQAPDPLNLELPEAQASDLPVPPVDLNSVRFAQDANLSDQQLALLAQNGFVVVPGAVAQFDELYRDNTWPHQEGKGDFISTDVLLHSLFLTYQNALMFLETEQFYGNVSNFIGKGYQAAEAQWEEAAGTALETPARNVAVYYAVPLLLLAPAEDDYVIGYEQITGFNAGDLPPSLALANADPAIIEEAQAIVDMIQQAEGRLELPFLENYTEDFSQYRVRGYYEGSNLLSSYFQAMMWLGRITFTVRSETDTISALLALRALENADGARQDWQKVSDTLAFMVGPTDDFGPVDYAPLAEEIFGDGLPMSMLQDSAKLAAFREALAELPGPRINSIPLPLGTQAENVDELTRGFRLFGQRFTLDGYIMQQLIYPEVGTDEQSRALPLGLDIAAVLGSDIAYGLADAAGATEYANYTENVAALREEINQLDANHWNENLYGGWLWALQPLLVRDPDLIPPMMQTDAWKRKDIHTMLGSWVELKHATLLYAEQPSGGLGGGGMEPPVRSTSYVEPNPLVFARIAITAATLHQGLTEQGFISPEIYISSGLSSVDDALMNLSVLSARLAETARKEVAGEPVSYQELYFLQERFGDQLWYIRYGLEEWITNPPENIALVADVASNPDAGLVLQTGIGEVDVIYVIANSTDGLHLTRGGVYSYYEFTNPIDNRLTDSHWREMVASDQVPPRPSWIDLYFGQ